MARGMAGQDIGVLYAAVAAIWMITTAPIGFTPITFTVARMTGIKDHITAPFNINWVTRNVTIKIIKYTPTVLFTEFAIVAIIFPIRSAAPVLVNAPPIANAPAKTAK